jgi:hypothetical protein
MDNLIVEATKSTPYVHFDAGKRLLEITGESYPENAAKFYGPLFDWLRRFLDSGNSEPLEVNLEIIYFNSSSSKALMVFFEMLEEAAVKGMQIVANWRYHEDNETALECGEEFKEDIPTLTFNLVQIAAE